MLKVSATLVSASPITFSAPIQSTKNTGEGHDAFEERTWRERLHVTPEGEVFIPSLAMQNCLQECAKFLSESVPGKGKATYTKHFDAGIMVVENLMLGIKAATVQPLRLFVPSDGIRGSGKRVWKNFPCIQKWTTEVSIYLLDPILIDKPGKVEEYLGHAGKFIGMGCFRPRNRGQNGRFDVKGFRVG